MTTQSENLLNQAIKLAPSERIVLVDALLDSLAPDDVERELSMDPEVGQAWGEEVRRRINDVESGRVKMIPAEQSLPETKQHE